MRAFQGMVLFTVLILMQIFIVLAYFITMIFYNTFYLSIGARHELESKVALMSFLTYKVDEAVADLNAGKEPLSIVRLTAVHGCKNFLIQTADVAAYFSNEKEGFSAILFELDKHCLPPNAQKRMFQIWVRDTRNPEWMLSTDFYGPVFSPKEEKIWLDDRQSIYLELSGQQEKKEDGREGQCALPEVKIINTAYQQEFTVNLENQAGIGEASVCNYFMNAHVVSDFEVLLFDRFGYLWRLKLNSPNQYVFTLEGQVGLNDIIFRATNVHMIANSIDEKRWLLILLINTEDGRLLLHRVSIGLDPFFMPADPVEISLEVIKNNEQGLSLIAGHDHKEVPNENWFADLKYQTALDHDFTDNLVSILTKDLAGVQWLWVFYERGFSYLADHIYGISRGQDQGYIDLIECRLSQRQKVYYNDWGLGCDYPVNFNYRWHYLSSKAGLRQ